MVTAIDRYLTEKASFQKSSKQVLEGKARLLRQQGKGKWPNKARSLTTTLENELWEKRSWEREVRKSLSKQFGGF